MAPVCTAGRLLLLPYLVFLLFLSIGTKQIESLLVYDRQSLLFLGQNVRDVDAFNHGGQNTVPPLLAAIPRHLYRASALRSRRKRPRRRGRRGGRLVRLKLQLACPSSISRTEYGLFPPFSVPRRFLDPIDACLVPVSGSPEGPRPRRLCPLRLSERGVNHRLLRTLPRVPRSTGSQAPATTRVGLVNARSLANKTFIVRNFFSSRGLDFLCMTETWISAGECSALVELLPADCSYFNSPRMSGRGGGTATIYKNNFKCKQRTASSSFSSFEVTLFEVGRSDPVLCAVIYRPPKYNRDFVNDFAGLLAEIMPNQFSVAFDQLCVHPASVNTEELSSWFHSSCRTILDWVAPLKTVQPKAKSEPWFNEGTRAARRECRKAEPVSLEASPEMCNSFLHFFIDKVATARALISAPASDPSDPVPFSVTLDKFEPVTLSFLEELVGHIKPSGSPCDAVSPRLFKEVFPSIGEAVLAIINSSLSSGVVPLSFKHAVVQPLLKKPGLDHCVLANFRPISKLPFISKILEKVVHAQLKSFLDEHGVLEVFQSGFKTLHSTESALLRVFNDILLANDSGDLVILVLLDLTAAFDTVDHNTLVARLHHLVGIRGTALEWFKSYLADRSMTVSLGNSESSSAPLLYGVPQGLILGPLLFSLYLLPLGSILRKHGISFHCYADDSQIYVPLKRKNAFSLTPLLSCLEDIKAWMALNFLNFNEKKMEVMVFGPSGPCEPPPVDLGPLAGYVKPTVSNLGFKMDSDFRLDRQISAVVKSSFFQIRQLAKVKPFLAHQHFETVIHAFITSRLDYCNALYFGVSQSSLARLQLVQNAAARLLTGVRKREHITPILASLHWLPVHFRVHFKILLFVFKSLHGLAPPYLSELLHPYAPARCLRSADLLLLEVPRSKRKLRGDRAFSVAAPKLWNELPLLIRQAPSLSTFKTRLKTHFYSLAFNPT
ncbi:uncharacterized protein LOC143326976 [Chaetodon auriga]|uniref:uncharacterized protein LOC143326976 n=1 Tax=Chaetodon auriga TaxID=39042 RepID=UPI004032D5D3